MKRKHPVYKLIEFLSNSYYLCPLNNHLWITVKSWWVTNASTVKYRGAFLHRWVQTKSHFSTCSFLLPVCKFPGFSRFLLPWLGLPDFFCAISSLRFVSTTKWSLLLLKTHSPHCKGSVKCCIILCWPQGLMSCAYFLHMVLWSINDKVCVSFCPTAFIYLLSVDQFRCCDDNSQCHTPISYSVLAFILSVPTYPWAITFIMTIISIRPPAMSQ